MGILKKSFCLKPCHYDSDNDDDLTTQSRSTAPLTRRDWHEANTRQDCQESQTSEQSRFKSSTTYPIENCLGEQDRLITHHYLEKLVWNTNFSAPIEEHLHDGMNVLDIGCGPGTWCLEMAAEYPNSMFYGVEHSAMFPTEIKPSNVSFIKANILEGLQFLDMHFDYIFVRDMAFAFTRQQWVGVLDEIRRLMRPGGWVEFMESDAILLNSGPYTKVFFETWRHYLAQNDVDPNFSCSLYSHLCKHRWLTDVREEQRESPVGRWGEIAGKLLLQDQTQLIDAIAPIIGIRDEHLALVKRNFAQESEYLKHEIVKRRIFAQKQNST